jgi:peptide/nickel transport system permease protein
MANSQQIIDTKPEVQAYTSEFRRFIRVFFGRKLVAFGCGFILLTVIVAIFAPLLAPYDPYAIHPADKLLQPSLSHPFGTDNVGRDSLSRIIFGARTSLIVGILAVAAGSLVGQALGLTAAYMGGTTSMVIMRIIDALMCLPPLLNAVVISALLGAGIKNVTIALAIGVIPVQARLMYAQVLTVKENDYVQASTAIGASRIRTVFRHLVPNSYPPLLVAMTIDLGVCILGEAGLSFLGLGILPPTAAWGSMVNDGYPYLLSNPVLSFAPGLAIMLVVFSFNMVGDGLRDTIDPRLRGTF